jgi:arylsulfatase A-like enzyme
MLTTLAAAAVLNGVQERPNIIFIFTDDHASHSISAYGSNINHTPHMDQLAADGMLFENAFVTNSICAPSRAVVLSGKHSHFNGQRTNFETFDGGQRTFPKILQESGYQTAIIGKWHLKSDPTGFDYFDVLIGQGPYYNPTFKSKDGNKRFTGYTTHIITEKTLDWLKDRESDQPFMLMMQHKAPHRQWRPGPDYIDLYEGETIPEPVDLFDDWSTRVSVAKDNKMSIREHLRPNYDLKIGEPPRNFNQEQKDLWLEHYGPRNAAFEAANLQGDDLIRWKYQRYIKDYLRCIQSVDDSVGELVGYLKEAGIDDNTIVIYNSDQGFYLGDYGWYDKRWMYEPSMRTPLIVKWPGVTEPGSRTELMAQNLDLAQTMLDMAGADADPGMQGVSLVPVLKGEEPGDWRNALYYHYYESPSEHGVPFHCGVRTDRFKLIFYYEIGEWEMFDLKNDPRENNDLYDKAEWLSIQTRLKRLLRSVQKQYGDTTGPQTNFTI